jgi:hypothetical protein
MVRITTASLDLRLTETDARLELLLDAVSNLALLVAGNSQEAKPTQDSPVQEPKAKTDHQKMGEQNEARGLMYTARYACKDCGPKQTGFYKLTSAEGHAERKGHKIGTLTFDLS